VESVVLPGWEGEMEVLAGHVPYVVLLKKGRIRTKLKDKSDIGTYLAEEGIAQVTHDTVDVLTKSFTAQ
jgi:F0F1-type ATP synthase epsilon subunit